MKLVKKKLKGILIIFLIFAVISCNHNPESDLEKNPTINDSTESEEKEDSFLVNLYDPYLWDVEYDKTSSTLSFPQAFRSATFPFETFDATKYSYAKLSYSDLTNARIHVDLTYSDDSYSRVYLQPDSNKIYIKLNESKKKGIKNISFQLDYFDGNFSHSFKLGQLKFVKTKPADNFTLAKDKISGNFDDRLTGMELSKKMAIGWNASRLATCPHYDTQETQYLRFGLQEEYESKKDANGNPVKDSTQTTVIASKILGTSTMGLASEYSILAPENKDYIKAGYDYGLKTLRINATWFPHIIDENYTIDPHWMARVKEVVDWAISDGYFVILNDHHSVYRYMTSPITYGTGYNICETDKNESEKFLKAIWKQIAEYFNGSYDEHLIFETLNEPRKACSPLENENGEYWPYQLQSADRKALTAILNEYNQIIVDTIRASGGNNAKRFIMIPTYATDRTMLFDCDFKLPEDSATNKLMIALHWYPFLEYPGVSEYTPEMKNNIISTFEKIYDSYTSKGIPINFTEFMVPNLGTEGQKYSKATRLECLKDFCKYAGLYKISATLWDDGMVHGVINRTAPYQQTEGDDFISTLITEWENGWNKNPQNLISEYFEQNKTAAVSVLDSPVQIENWDNPINLSVEASKLSALKAGSIIKISLTSEGFTNFCLNKINTWTKINITGEINSENIDLSDSPNFGYTEAAPLYIKLSAEDAAVLKNGFSIVGMNLTVTDISIIF